MLSNGVDQPQRRTRIATTLSYARGARVPLAGCLSLLERSDARQHLALEQLQRGATTGRDVRHLVGEASLLDGSDRVTAADDRRAAVARELGERVRNVEGALGERLEL